MKSLEERQATLLTVVERERAAKLRAIEQAAGVAAAAETLAESAPGADPQALSKTAKDAAADTYEDAAYTHQGWLTEDQTHLFLDDEADERRGDWGGNTRTMTVRPSKGFLPCRDL